YRSRSQHQLLASLPLAASPAPGCLACPGPQAPCASDQTGTMSTFGYRRGLSKYESIDEDELLASLTAEELKELERELEDIEPDRNLPVGLRQKSLTEKTPTGNFSREALMAYWEKESQKLLEKERLGECGKVGFPDLSLAAPRPPPPPPQP
ncbi:PREDICTED: leiomodin-2-like, partial [Myotis brandtii]|uniref:leiomodin-2-like n=1 Tax=Myotis brandtii TaxID=109478 RepID=UPI00070476B6